MYEKIVYVGQLSHVLAKDFDFVKDIPTAVPASLAPKLLRSPEFIRESEFLARQTVPLSTAPAEEPVDTVPVAAPAQSAPKSKPKLNPSPSSPSSKRSK